MNTKEKIAAQVIRRGGGRSSVFGLLAAAALLIGWFLPLAGAGGSAGAGLDLDRATTLRSLRKSEDERAHAIAARLENGEAISGAQWVGLLDDLRASGNLNATQERRVEAAYYGLAAMPWALAGLVILLLALGIDPAKALRYGGGPLAGVLMLCRSRLFGGFLLALTMTFALAVLLVTMFLWQGAKLLDIEESSAGLGLRLMVGGSAVSLASAFLGYGPGRLRALLAATVLVGAAFGLQALWVSQAGG